MTRTIRTIARRKPTGLRGWGKCKLCRFPGMIHCNGDNRGCSCTSCH